MAFEDFLTLLNILFMKLTKLLFIFMLLPLLSFGQEGGTECAANVVPLDTICYSAPMFLTGTDSEDYNEPPNVLWTYEGGPLPASAISFSDATSLTPEVLHNGNSGTNWPTGNYLFKMCVDCKDIDGNGSNDRPCDFVTITVQPEVTAAEITDDYQADDGYIKTCDSYDLQVTAPTASEDFNVEIIPNDGLVLWQYENGTIQLFRMDAGGSNQGNCEYTIVYSIFNGGCISEANINVEFVKTRYAAGTNIVTGSISPGCPTCSLEARLDGAAPGCDATGVWTVTDQPPGSTYQFSNVNTTDGNADISVSLPGAYEFTYTVSGNAPCPESVFTLTCEFLDVDGFDLGPTQFNTACNDTLAAGTYSFAFNEIDNALYSWALRMGAGETNVPASLFTITDPHSHASDIIVSQTVVQPGLFATFSIEVERYYIDPDCDGPLPPQILELPFNDYQQNLDFVNNIINQPGVCSYKCTDLSFIVFLREPNIEIENETVYFLCNTGNDVFTLRDFINITPPNFSITDRDINVLQDPSGTLGGLNLSELITLTVNGDYLFEIEVTLDVNGVECTVTDTLRVVAREQEPVNAGTDQIKCVNEETRLNGNVPYGSEISGTWQQVNCNPCTITFVDPNDPNTQILLTGLDPNDLPVDLEFEWSFPTESNCNLSDTTKVTVDDCFLDCSQFQMYVEEDCQEEEEQIVLTLRNQNTFLIGPPYQIAWTINGAPGPGGNPIIIPGTDPVDYSVQVTLLNGDTLVCENTVVGRAGCGSPACDTLLMASPLVTCGEDEVIFSVVDEDNNPLSGSTYSLVWTINGVDQPSGVNPVSLPNTGTFTYSVALAFTDDGLVECDTTFTGSIACPIPACDTLLNVSVVEECSEEEATFKVVDGSGAALSAADYQIIWTINGQTETTSINPISKTNVGNFTYSVEVSHLLNDEILCDTTLTGVLTCPVPPCDTLLSASVKQSCTDEKLFLSLLDADDKLIDPVQYHVQWTINGIPQTPNTNPVNYPNVGTFTYTVTAYYEINGDTICNLSLAGNAVCEVPQCTALLSAKVIEECSIEELTLKAVNDSGVLLDPGDYEILWTVNGTAYTPSQNPITVANAENNNYSVQIIYEVLGETVCDTLLTGNPFCEIPCEPLQPDLERVDCINFYGEGFTQYYAVWTFEENGLAEPCGEIRLVNAYDGENEGNFDMLSYTFQNGTYIFEGVFTLYNQELHDICWEVNFCEIGSGEDCGTVQICPSDYFPYGCPCFVEEQCDPYSTIELGEIDCVSPETNYYPYQISAQVIIPMPDYLPEGCALDVTLESFSGESDLQHVATYLYNGGLVANFTLPFNDQGYVDILCLEANVYGDEGCGGYQCSFVECFDISAVECGGNNGGLQLIFEESIPTTQREEGIVVYPNPAGSIFYVDYAVATTKTNYELEVRDVLGKVVAQRSLNYTSGQVEIPTAIWPSGVYQVILKVDGKVEQLQKLIVSH